jgi:PGF-CTERM protein
LSGATVGTAGSTAAADYTIDQVSKLSYYDQNGFEDKNDDGMVTVVISEHLDYERAGRYAVTFDVNKPIVIRGQDGAAITNASKTPFRTTSGKSLTVTDLELSNIEATPIRANGSVTVTDVSISNANGGVKSSGNLSATNLTVTDSNWGVRASDSLTVTDSRFYKLSGTALATGGSATVEGTSVGEGSSYGNGGALRTGQGATIRNSEFWNLSARNGGAIYTNGPTRIVASTFRSTGTANVGGAVYVKGTTTVVDSRFVDTKIPSVNGGTGGAIYSKHNATVRGTVIEGGRADSGGAIYVDGGRLIFEDSAIRNVGGRTVVEVHAITRDDYDESNDVYLTSHIRESTVYRNNIFSVEGSLMINDSAFVRTGRFSVNSPGGASKEFRMRNSTIMNSTGTPFRSGSQSWVIPESYSLHRVNLLEEHKPIFKGDLPKNGTAVFIDLASDDEAMGEWTAEPFYSRSTVYPSASLAQRVLSDARERRQTPTPTPTPTPTATPTDATPAPATATETPAETDRSDSDGSSDESSPGEADADGSNSSGPGFGVVTAVVTLVLAALAVTQRNRDT